MSAAVILPGIYGSALLYRNPHLTNIYVHQYYASYDYANLGLKYLPAQNQRKFQRPGTNNKGQDAPLRGKPISGNYVQPDQDKLIIDP
jgi:hypothetical protein